MRSTPSREELERTLQQIEATEARFHAEFGIGHDFTKDERIVTRDQMHRIFSPALADKFIDTTVSNVWSSIYRVYKRTALLHPDLFVLDERNP